MSLSVLPLNATVRPGDSITLRCPAGGDGPGDGPGGPGSGPGGPGGGPGAGVTVFWVYSEEGPPRLTTVQELRQAQRAPLLSDRVRHAVGNRWGGEEAGRQKATQTDKESLCVVILFASNKLVIWYT